MFNFNRYTLISSSFAFLTSIRYSKAVMGKCKYIREKLWLTICIISRGRSANRAPEGNSNIKGPGNSLFLEVKKEGQGLHPQSVFSARGGEYRIVS